MIIIIILILGARANVGSRCIVRAVATCIRPAVDCIEKLNTSKVCYRVLPSLCRRICLKQYGLKIEASKNDVLLNVNRLCTKHAYEKKKCLLNQFSHDELLEIIINDVVAYISRQSFCVLHSDLVLPSNGSITMLMNRSYHYY